MQPTQKFEEDVAFVREAVEKRDRMQYNSIAIAVLWAIILATGYALNDFRPEVSHLFLAHCDLYRIPAQFLDRQSGNAGERHHKTRRWGQIRLALGQFVCRYSRCCIHWCAARYGPGTLIDKPSSSL